MATPWTAVCQTPVSMGFPKQEYWSGLPLPSPGDILHPGIEPASPALAGEFYTTKPPGKPPFFPCFSGELQLIHSHFPPNIWLLSLKLEKDESLIWRRVSREDSQFPCRRRLVLSNWRSERWSHVVLTQYLCLHGFQPFRCIHWMCLNSQFWVTETAQSSLNKSECFDSYNQSLQENTWPQQQLSPPLS